LAKDFDKMSLCTEKGPGKTQKEVGSNAFLELSFDDGGMVSYGVVFPVNFQHGSWTMTVTMFTSIAASLISILRGEEAQ